MPPKYYRLFRYLLLRRWRRPVAWYIKLEQLLGAKDFIAEDPAVSIDNLLAHKHRHPALAGSTIRPQKPTCWCWMEMGT